MRGIQRGVYIEQNNNRSVFLMRDGRFIHGRPSAPLSIGEEGSFYPLTAKPKWKWRPIFAPALAIIAILMLFFSALLPSEDAFAYVQLEMDSNIEFGVDKAIRVISIRELNEDGQKLIVKLGDWEGEALDKLIERSIAISVTDETEKVTITTAAEKSADNAEIKFEKMVLAASVAAAKRDIDVRVKKATFVQWEKSVEEEIPVGQKVENFTSVESEEKSRTDQDNEIDMKNDKKALKTEKNQSRVKNKVMDEEIEVKPEPAAKTDEGKASIEKKKPLEKNGEVPAAGKADKFVPPGKAEKAKPTGTTPKTEAIEEKPGVTLAPSEKVKPAATEKPASVTANSNSEKATAEKQEPKAREKAKPQAIPNPKPKEKPVAQDKPKEQTEVQAKLKKQTKAQSIPKQKNEAQGKPKEKAAHAKPEKSGKAEAEGPQNQQGKQPAQTPNGKQTGEKKEQK